MTKIAIRCYENFRKSDSLNGYNIHERLACMHRKRYIRYEKAWTGLHNGASNLEEYLHVKQRLTVMLFMDYHS